LRQCPGIGVTPVAGRFEACSSSRLQLPSLCLGPRREAVSFMLPILAAWRGSFKGKPSAFGSAGRRA